MKLHKELQDSKTTSDRPSSVRTYQYVYPALRATRGTRITTVDLVLSLHRYQVE